MDEPPTLGERAADRIAAAFGSWRFITQMTVFIAIWVMWNILAAATWRFDRYPFIFLTLVLSLQASYAAPLILLAQNRAAAYDTSRRDLDLSTDTASLALLRRIADHLGIEQ